MNRSKSLKQYVNIYLLINIMNDYTYYDHLIKKCYDKIDEHDDNIYNITQNIIKDVQEMIEKNNKLLESNKKIIDDCLQCKK